MNKSFIFVFSVLPFFFVTSTVNAQVVINELGSYESSHDWVELFSDSDEDLVGYKLTHLTSNGEEKDILAFDSTTLIGPGTSQGFFYIVEAGNTLNKNGDRIKLYDSEGKLISDIYYGDKGGPCYPLSGQSIGSTTDGSNNIERFERFAFDTKGKTNADATLLPCPTPTPLPTNTNTPTLKPTKTPIPTKTETPLPTNSPTRNPTATPAEIIDEEGPEIVDEDPMEKDQSSDEVSVLGTDTKVKDVSDDNLKTDVEKKEKGKIPILAGVFIAGGLLFIVFAVYPFVKPIINRYNKRIKK